MRAEIPVLQPTHCPVRQRLQGPRATRLRNAIVEEIRARTEVGAEREVVKKKAATHGIRRSGNRYALMGRWGCEPVWDCKMTEHPAICQMIIQDVGVTVVLSLTGPAEAAPQ